MTESSIEAGNSGELPLGAEKASFAGDAGNISQAGLGEAGLVAQDSLNRALLLQRRLVCFALLTILFVFSVALVNYLADVFRILGISVLISYLFINLVDWLNKLIPNRAVSAFIVYGVCVVVLALVLIMVVPSVFYQLNQLLQSLFAQVPILLTKFFEYIKPLDERLHTMQVNVKAIDLLGGIAQSLPTLDTSFILNRMSEMAMSTMTGLFYALSILVLSFYFLLEGHRMTEKVIALFPQPTKRQWLSELASDIDLSLQAFFHGQLVMAFSFALIMLVVYLILGVPFALVLAVILAVSEIIPVIGPPIGFLPAVVVVALNGLDHFSIERAWQVVIFLAVVNICQWLKDNLFAPRYIGNAVGLHPVVIFISIMIGARVDGMLGVIFAIPLAIVANVALGKSVREARSVSSTP